MKSRDEPSDRFTMMNECGDSPKGLQMLPQDWNIQQFGQELGNSGNTLTRLTNRNHESRVGEDVFYIDLRPAGKDNVSCRLNSPAWINLYLFIVYKGIERFESGHMLYFLFSFLFSPHSHSFGIGGDRWSVGQYADQMILDCWWGVGGKLWNCRALKGEKVNVFITSKTKFRFLG